ncbi:hypothetical protein FB451DRAFT_1439469 [Mycena latifolia]|nr:hypothetical protein FB451DRAFT_1439469 [Mycena latifolia]
MSPQPSTDPSGASAALPTASERASLAADRARSANIGAHIAELERSLHSLKQERDILQRRLEAYTYPVLALPNEIVSEIFVHFLPVYPERPPIIGRLSPVTLGEICRKWREIAFSTPTLWRGISFLNIRSFGESGELEDDFPLITAFHTAPLLRRIAFGLYRDIFSTIFPWSQITILSVQLIARHQWASILNQAASLIQCNLGFYPSLDDPGHQSLSAIANPCIETLVLTGASVVAPILDRMTLPVLRRLQVAESMLGPDPVGTQASFLSRSRCRLQELSVITFDLCNDRYLTALPSVGIFMFDRNLDGCTFLEDSDSEYDEGEESDSAEASNTDEESDGPGDEYSSSDEESD